MLKKVQTIGSLITAMSKIKLEREKLSAADKKLVKDFDELEKELIALYKTQGTNKASQGQVLATLKITPRPKIVDDALLWKFVKKNDYYHLYYRRLNQTAYEELIALNKGVALPGTEVFEDESISLTGLKQLST